MGPMNAARSFVELLAARELLPRTAQVSAQLYGSLALTGRGHGPELAPLLKAMPAGAAQARLARFA